MLSGMNTQHANLQQIGSTEKSPCNAKYQLMAIVNLKFRGKRPIKLECIKIETKIHKERSVGILKAYY